MLSTLIANGGAVTIPPKLDTRTCRLEVVSVSGPILGSQALRTHQHVMVSMLVLLSCVYLFTETRERSGPETLTRGFRTHHH